MAKKPTVYARTSRRFVLQYGGPDMQDYERHSGQIVYVERRVPAEDMPVAERDCPMYVVSADDGWTGRVYAEEIAEKIEKPKKKKTDNGMKVSIQVVGKAEFRKNSPRTVQVFDTDGVFYGQLGCATRTHIEEGNKFYLTTWEGNIAGTVIAETAFDEAKELAAQIVNGVPVGNMTASEGNYARDQ